MGYLNQPADLGMMIEQLESRIRALEVTSRVGINRLRYAYGTAAVDPTTYGSWETGAAGCTWIDDAAGVGTGYAQCTAETATKALVFFGCRLQSVGFDAGVTWKTSNGQVGVLQDGNNPGTAGNPAPVLSRQFFNGSADGQYQNISYVAIRTGLTPGKYWKPLYPCRLTEEPRLCHGPLRQVATQRSLAHAHP